MAGALSSAPTKYTGYQFVQASLSMPAHLIPESVQPLWGRPVTAICRVKVNALHLAGSMDPTKVCPTCLEQLV